jgi:hypothetical protein
MDNTNAPQTHVWADGDTPHQVKQDGRVVLHHRCLRCGRDFAQGLDGAAWQAVYIGIFKVELLADRVSDRWLREECPQRLLPDDDVSRATRRS